MTDPTPSDVTAHGTQRIKIFDTTLRDGEQSPGFTMNAAQKVLFAHALEDLGVDVIEAGFPNSSPADFGAVQSIAREIRHASICALARCHPRRYRRLRQRLAGCRRAAHPRVHLHQSAAPPAQARHERRPGHRTRGDGRHPRAQPRRGRGVLRRGRAAHRTRIPGPRLRGRHRSRRAHAQRAGHRRLHHARRNPRAVRIPARQRARRRRRGLQRALPQRPGLGRRELAGRDRGRCAPGRMHHQRHRRTCRQRGDGGAGDGAEGAPRLLRRGHPAGHDEVAGHVAVAVADHRHPGPAQQGDRRSQRIRA